MLNCQFIAGVRKQNLYQIEANDEKLRDSLLKLFGGITNQFEEVKCDASKNNSDTSVGTVANIGSMTSVTMVTSINNSAKTNCNSSSRDKINRSSHSAGKINRSSLTIDGTNRNSHVTDNSNKRSHARGRTNSVAHVAAKINRSYHDCNGSVNNSVTTVKDNLLMTAVADSLIETTVKENLAVATVRDNLVATTAKDNLVANTVDFNDARLLFSSPALTGFCSSISRLRLKECNSLNLHTAALVHEFLASIVLNSEDDRENLSHMLCSIVDCSSPLCDETLRIAVCSISSIEDCVPLLKFLETKFPSSSERLQLTRNKFFRMLADQIKSPSNKLLAEIDLLMASFECNLMSKSPLSERQLSKTTLNILFPRDDLSWVPELVDMIFKASGILKSYNSYTLARLCNYNSIFIMI